MTAEGLSGLIQGFPGVFLLIHTKISFMALAHCSETCVCAVGATGVSVAHMLRIYAALCWY